MHYHWDGGAYHTLHIKILNIIWFAVDCPNKLSLDKSVFASLKKLIFGEKLKWHKKYLLIIILRCYEGPASDYSVPQVLQAVQDVDCTGGELKSSVSLILQVREHLASLSWKSVMYIALDSEAFCNKLVHFLIVRFMYFSLITITSWGWAVPSSAKLKAN